MTATETIPEVLPEVPTTVPEVFRPDSAVELLYKVADMIEKYPGLHGQHTWGRVQECGTVHCIAGHAAALSGCSPCDEAGGREIWTWVIPLGEGGTTPIYDYSREALGLSMYEANKLFHPEREPKKPLTVPQALREIAAGALVKSVSL